MLRDIRTHEDSGRIVNATSPFSVARLREILKPRTNDHFTVKRLGVKFQPGTLEPMGTNGGDNAVFVSVPTGSGVEIRNLEPENGRGHDSS